MPTASANETQIFYCERGSGQPCLAMHGGLGFDYTHLRPWVDPLGDTMRLIYYDHRGNGRSSRSPLDTLTFEHSGHMPYIEEPERFAAVVQA